MQLLKQKGAGKAPPQKASAEPGPAADNAFTVRIQHGMLFAHAPGHHDPGYKAHGPCHYAMQEPPKRSGAANVFSSVIQKLEQQYVVRGSQPASLPVNHKSI